MAPATGSEVNKFNPNELDDLLPIYYTSLFPSRLFFKWLSYGESEDSDESVTDAVLPVHKKMKKYTYFERREFSFTLAGDIYIRYLSFSNDSDLSKQLQAKNPIKIDIGAVFTSNPRDVKKEGMLDCKAEERELVFDIDMTDYDEVRTCCSGADVCKKCWSFLVIAAKILDRSLREDFGFQHILWVFSGRRGIHCWICDESARKLNIEGRAALASYLTVIEGGQYATKKVNLDRKRGDVLHPVIKRALDIIEEAYPKLILQDQKLFEDKKFVESIIAMSKTAFDGNLRSILKSNMAKGSEKIWDAMKSEAKNTERDEHFLKELMLQLCYPRLDINVTKGINHLLKAPFCIHPKTGKVCVPFDISQADTFDPTNVPTINKLINQLQVEQQGTKNSSQPLYSITDMKPYITLFEKFVNKLSKERIGQRLVRNDEKMEF